MSYSLLSILQIYAIAGVAVAAVFLLWGIERVAPDARGAYIFRPLLMPGIVMIWPLVLWRWAILERGRDQPDNRHRPPRRVQDALAVVLAVLIAVILTAALLVRQQGPVEQRAVPLEVPAGEPAATGDGQ
ncbi:MAG: hypothetical protein RLO50_02025 [Azospirillaceae bacterium]